MLKTGGGGVRGKLFVLELLLYPNGGDNMLFICGVCNGGGGGNILLIGVDGGNMLLFGSGGGNMLFIGDGGGSISLNEGGGGNIPIGGGGNIPIGGGGSIPIGGGGGGGKFNKFDGGGGGGGGKFNPMFIFPPIFITFVLLFPPPNFAYNNFFAFIIF